MSHPLLVEAAESLFVPLAVYNNIPGEDAITLKGFKEPAWNNPIVRIVSSEGEMLAPRVHGDYTLFGLCHAMAGALQKSGKPVPEYLRLLEEEEHSRYHGLERATFAMHCFWEGEGALGAVGGVVSTRPGFLGGLEVVEVEFDRERVSYDALLKEALRMDCANRVFTRNGSQQDQAVPIVGNSAVRNDDEIQPDKEPKYYLSRTEYRFVPMTSLQSTRVNSRLGKKRDPAPLLSPRQQDLLRKIREKPDAGWVSAVGETDLSRAWARSREVAARVR